MANSKFITVGDGVVVFGAEMVPAKLLEVLNYLLQKETSNNLRAVFFSIEGPGDRNGEYCKYSRSFVVNLSRIAERLEGLENGMSLMGAAWLNTIHVMAHELHHNVAFFNEKELCEQRIEEEEENAHEFADEILSELITATNAEMPKKGEWPTMEMAIMGVLARAMKDPAKMEWVKTQKARLDENVVFESREDIFDTMIEYIKATEPDTQKVWVKENPGAAMEMTAKPKDMPNLFDQQLMPGGQGDLFGTKKSVVDFNKVKPITTPMTTQELAASSQEQLAVVEAKGNAMDVYDDEGTYVDEWNNNEVLDELDEDDPVTATFGGVPIADPFGTITGNSTPQTPVAAAPAVTVGNPFGTVPQMGTAPKSDPAQTKVAPKVDVAIARNLYRRCVAHIFTNCGFQAGFFTNPNGIFTPMPLTDEEKQFVIGSRTVMKRDAQGNPEMGFADVKKTGFITGQLYKDGKLPTYELLLIWGNKTRTIRILPQNADKNTPTALMAKSGIQLTWIIDVEGIPTQNAKGETFLKKYMAKITNGEYEAL